MSDRAKRIAIRSSDGSPTVISGAPDSPGRSFFRRTVPGSLEELQRLGAIPRFVDVRAVGERVARMRADQAYETRARAQLEAEGRRPRDGAGGGRVFQAQVAGRATQLRVADLADGLSPNLKPQVRVALAGRSLYFAELARRPIGTVTMEADIEVHTDLVFDADVSLCRLGEVRIYRGARIEARASWFVMNATSIRGGLSPAPVAIPLNGGPIHVLHS